jgi:hypothetical protein
MLELRNPSEFPVKVVKLHFFFNVCVHDACLLHFNLSIDPGESIICLPTTKSTKTS